MSRRGQVAMNASRPADFPGGGNRSRVCCHGVLPSISFHCSCATWARQYRLEHVRLDTVGENSQVRGLVVPGCLEKGDCTFLPLRNGRLGKKGDRTAQRGRSPCVPRVLVHMRVGEAQLSGRILVRGAGHCLSVCGGLLHP